ncbi:hypothetical protein [Nitrosomonas supralitoralis]|uniref:hypothetical protein n=1 Tax=Nitrosomonas supralitoralis TaxID=2116706 RepID=UPI001559A8CF|nr:hypothetical protein [Nitrosomonas supralitoralis]
MNIDEAWNAAGGSDIDITEDRLLLPTRIHSTSETAINVWSKFIHTPLTAPTRSEFYIYFESFLFAPRMFRKAKAICRTISA